MRRQWDMLTAEKKRECIAALIEFFHSERGEEIGNIAAEELIDFFMREVGLLIYNQGVDDAIRLCKDRFSSLEIDADSLLKK